MRVDYTREFPAARQAMLGPARAANSGSFESPLLELVKIRASQLNGCAHCLEMRTKDARALGGDDDRMDLVAAWREAPCFTPHERAALQWCEALTALPQTGTPDEAFGALAEVFTPEQVVALTLAVVAINGWNRFAVGLRAPVGDYRPRSADGSSTRVSREGRGPARTREC